mmetsp:Transcript_21710/g.42187  ORF Transcript_21710/g.42187 Transcript_21710/m.42187 type:complete len:221 (-) Transcript_21710:89-751(-)
MGKGKGVFDSSTVRMIILSLPRVLSFLSWISLLLFFSISSSRISMPIDLAMSERAPTPFVRFPACLRMSRWSKGRRLPEARMDIRICSKRFFATPSSFFFCSASRSASVSTECTESVFLISAASVMGLRNREGKSSPFVALGGASEPMRDLQACLLQALCISCPHRARFCRFSDRIELVRSHATTSNRTLPVFEVRAISCFTSSTIRRQRVWPFARPRKR